MLLLAIETSCDETGAAVVKDGTHVLSNAIASSRSDFTNLAGVIPEQAARRQLECIQQVVEKAMSDGAVTFKDVDAIAVTRGPGLLGSLLIGTTCARLLSSIHHLPLIGVHHTLGHLSSTWLDATEDFAFPILTLSASGGHTDLWYRTSHTKGQLLGRTRDDAAGEAFDKGASLLGLPYPGGPAIAKEAEKGDASRFAFPLPLSHEDALDFSFSGLKTSLRYLLRDQKIDDPSSIDPTLRSDIAASYQHALCHHLVHVLEKAIGKYPDIREVHLVGGVSANLALRALAKTLCDRESVTLRFPSKIRYCTDNAAMIGAAGEFLIREHGQNAYQNFDTVASLPLEETIS